MASESLGVGHYVQVGATMKRKRIVDAPLSKVQYCLPCGIDGRPVPASTEVDGDPMCVGCALAASKAVAQAAAAPVPQARRWTDALD
jgi:hypothetical protein